MNFIYKKNYFKLKKYAFKMGNNLIVGINIFVDGKLINDNNVPILYYWNNEEDIEDELSKSDDLIFFLTKKITTPSEYLNSNLTYVKYDNFSKEYTSNRLNIQNLFDLKHFNEYNENFWINFIINDFLNLYQLSYKQTYELSSSLDEDIKNMFVKIKQKYPNKVNKDTIVNYIFSKLNENKLLSVDNTNYIINKLKQLITL